MQKKKITSLLIALSFLASLAPATISASADDTTTDDTTSTVSATIHFDGTTITADNTNVTISGTTVTIPQSGTYTFTGAMTTSAMITVATDSTDEGSVDIVLQDVTMTNSTDTPCIYISNADKTKITFSGTNTLTNTYDANEPANPVILAKDDLTFTKNSDGVLNIVTTAQVGIEENNDLKINGGTLNITTGDNTQTDAEADGIKSKDTVTISGGAVTVDASGDGIKTTSKGTAVTIEDGTVAVKAANDAIQANTDLAISGGTVYASGDKGLTSAGTLTITGGSVLATAKDNQAEYTSSAGTQNIALFTLGEEHKKSESVTFGSTTYEPQKKYSYLLISNPELTTGTGYALTVGDSAMTQEDENATFTLTDTITSFTTAPLSTTVAGDLDGDTKVTVSDAFITLMDVTNVSAGLASSLTDAQVTAGDVDGNGSVTINDAFLILQFSAMESAGLSPSWSDLVK